MSGFYQQDFSHEIFLFTRGLGFNKATDKTDHNLFLQLDTDPEDETWRFHSVLCHSVFSQLSSRGRQATAATSFKVQISGHSTRQVGNV